MIKVGTCEDCGQRPCWSYLSRYCAACEDVRYWASLTPEQAAVVRFLDSPLGDVGDSDRKGRSRKEQEQADPEAKARHAEAMAFIASYTGSWGLILDLRADRRWGTKYMKLSDRQVEVVLKAKERDAERARVAQVDPRQQAARAFLETATARPGFEADMVARAKTGTSLSEGQLAAVERWAERAGTPRVQVEEGMYRTSDGTVWKVQQAKNGSGHLYAKRLVVYSPGNAAFEFERGAISKLRPEDRMEVEEAAAFGKLYGVCAVCGRALTDEKSIADGIGPICAGKV